MTKIKPVYGLFFIEVMIIFFIYLFGKQGLPLMLQIKKENGLIEQEINDLKSQVAALEKKIKDWRTYPFYKEKIAREQLQMAREGEQIYYFPNQKDA